MSFLALVLQMLRQMRIGNRVNAFIERFRIPEWSFLFLLCAFPLFQVFEHSTLCLLPICAFLLFWFVRSLLRHPKSKLDFADFLVLLFLLLQLSTALTGYGRVVDAVTAALLTSVYFFARRFFAEQSGNGLVFFSSLALLVVSTIGVGQYAFGVAELRWVDAKRFGDIGGRVTSLFDNPNILAVYLLLYFPLSLWAAFSGKNNRRLRVFYAVTAAFCALCILLTWSRGAWLGLFLECLLFLLFYSCKSRKGILFLPPLALLTIPFLPQSFRTRLLSIGDLGESSIRYRLQTWVGTCRMLAEHPFGIGVGERAWRVVYPHFAVSGTKRVMHAHNVFLQVATELGALGLALFAWLLGIAFWNGFKQKHFVAISALAGALTMGLFDHLWYYPGLLVPFWSMLAFCVSRERQMTEKFPFVDILHEKR